MNASRRIAALLTTISSAPKRLNRKVHRGLRRARRGDVLGERGTRVQGLRKLLGHGRVGVLAAMDTPASAMTTFAPWRANSSAIARPMPRAAAGHQRDSALRD